VEVLIGKVSGKDVKSSGQRVTEKGRLSHPADLAKTDETISNQRPGQLFNPARILCLRAACPHHLKAHLTLSLCCRVRVRATAQDCLWTCEMFKDMCCNLATRKASYIYIMRNLLCNILKKTIKVCFYINGGFKPISAQCFGIWAHSFTVFGNAYRSPQFQTA